MKGKLVNKLLENRKIVRAGCGLMAAAVLLSGGLYIYDSQNNGAVLPTVIEEGSVVIDDEAVPLATAPTVKKLKPTTKTTTKKVKLKKANKKTYTKKLKTKKSTKTTTKSYADRTEKTVTKTTTTTTEKYKKKQKFKTVVTKVKTEVTITTTMKATASNTKANTAAIANTPTTSGTSETVVKKTLPISSTLPKADANVRDAFEKMGFTIQVDSTVTYTGKFDAKSRTITMRKEDHDAVYHELGHYLMFMYYQNTANDGGAEGQAAYAAEKGLYNGFNQEYVNQNASEYMAESYRDYCTNPTVLQAERPQTYALIEKAVASVTEAKIAKLQRLYAAYWQ